MRFFAVLLAVPILLSACRSTDDTNPDDAGRRPAATSSARGGERLASLGPAPATNAPPANPILLPTNGRVHSINSALRFVVIDYTLGGLPPLQSRLQVFRNDEKVGEVRLSGPERNGFVAADILDGFIQVDDQVRPN